MRVLVTGGLGAIGSQLARGFLDEGHEVVVVDACEARRNVWTRDRLLEHARNGQEVEILTGRLENGYFSSDGTRIGDLLLSCDAVVHAAASTGIPHSAEHPDDDWASNVDATKVLLDALREHPVPTVVLSSVKPYKVPADFRMRFEGGNPIGSHIGLHEDDPIEPDEPYAASKAAQSMLAMAWARTYELPVVTLRCSNLYGPGACHGPRHGWLTWFCISAAIGRALEVQGGGEQARDMLYGADVYSACLSALSQARTLAGKVFNVGGGAPNIISVRQAAEWLGERSDVEVVAGPGRRHEDQLVFVDHAAFTAATGWSPAVSVSEGMTRTYAWALQHKDELHAVYEGV